MSASIPLVPTSPMTFGFSQYLLLTTVGGPAVQLGRTYPLSKSDALRALWAQSYVPTPTQVIDRSVTTADIETNVPVMGSQPTRGWLAFYNPAWPQVQISLTGPATWGVLTNLILGPGEAYFWANAQGLGQCWQGPIEIVGAIPDMQFWAWESGGATQWLTDDYGNLITNDAGQAIPVP